jgi:hypothetical protein
VARFEIPAHRLFGIAQYDKAHFAELRKSVVKAVHGSGEVPSHQVSFDEHFVRGKFLDLVNSQFELPRSVVELASNAVDATREKGGGKVSITVGRNGVVVRDNGGGMTLDSMMQNLSVPYYSGKARAETGVASKQIGRFGLGFLSNLSFLTSGTARAVRVESNSGGHATAAEFSLKPSDNSPTGNDVMAAFEKTSAAPGTRVEISGELSKRQVKEISRELSEYLQHVSPKHAVIELNGRQLNRPPRLSRYARKYEIPFGDEKIVVDLDFGSRMNTGRYLPITSGGILLNKMPYNYGAKPFRTVVHMPASFQVGENRRDFRETPELKQAEAIVFSKLWDYVQEMEGERKTGRAALDFKDFKRAMLGGFTQLGFKYKQSFGALAKTDKIIEYANGLRKPYEPKLDPQKRLVVSDERHLDATHFITADANFYGEGAYHQFFSPFNSGTLENKAAVHLGAFLEERRASKPFPFSKLPAAEKKAMGFEEEPEDESEEELIVHRVSLSPQNHSPFLFVQKSEVSSAAEKTVAPGLYVNVNHPALTGATQQDRAWAKRCLAIALYGHDAAEQKLIFKLVER